MTPAFTAGAAGRSGDLPGAEPFAGVVTLGGVRAIPGDSHFVNVRPIGQNLSPALQKYNYFYQLPNVQGIG